MIFFHFRFPAPDPPAGSDWGVDVVVIVGPTEPGLFGCWWAQELPVGQAFSLRGPYHVDLDDDRLQLWRFEHVPRSRAAAVYRDVVRGFCRWNPDGPDWFMVPD